MSESYQEGDRKVSRRCLENIWTVLKGIWKMSAACLECIWKVPEGIRKMSESCLEAIWKASGRLGRCLEGAWKVPRKRSDSVWKFYGTYLEDIWKV